MLYSKEELEPIAEFLKNRFDFEWNLEEQIKRSEKFEKERQSKYKQGFFH